MEIILSSCKAGYSVRELMSDDTSEYWNSDDALSHSVRISFPYETYVHELRIFLSYSLDESYTPEKVVAFVNGTKRGFTFTEPEGTQVVPIMAVASELLLVVLSNHADGKDSRIRSLRVMRGPDEEIKYDADKYR